MHAWSGPRPSRRTVLTGGGATAGACLFPALGAAAGNEPQRYVSDYISFVGRDEKGYVYLAHDNNRGQTGDRFFADHWINMFDAASGWVEVKGSEHYANPDKALDTIPPSAHFSFAGSPQTGLSMIGRTNDMELTIAALPATLRRENADGVFWVGGAPATMVWKGRRLEGRVLFEYLKRVNWNRFTNTFEANWKNFNGLYLMTDDSADFYMHFHEREGGSDLTGRLVGLASWGTPAPISDIDFKITERELDGGKGRFHWPLAWSIGFTHAGKRYRAELATRHKNDVAWWETGGFRMAVVEGTIVSADGARTMKATGWGELLI